ncbi:MAG: hypothetical protein JSS10_04550 [Verrucomicrobia bacterium]|nr:hypothetical protein [Verrucomicrobiota bacterium]
MEISNLIYTRASSLFRHLRDSLQSLPQVSPSVGKFEGATVPSDSIPLTDRVTAPIPRAEAIPPSHPTVQETGGPDLIVKHIFQPLSKLFKKSLSSGPFPEKNPTQITGRVILLAGGALISVYVLFKFVIPYFFPQPESGKNPGDSLDKPSRDFAPPPANAADAQPALPPPPVPQPAAPGQPSSPRGKPAAASAAPPPANAAAEPIVPPPVPQPAAPQQPSSPRGKPAAAVPLPAAIPAAAKLGPPAPPVDAEKKDASPPAAASSIDRHSPSRSSASSPAPKLLFKQAAGLVRRTIFSTRHFSKWKKYRIIQDLMERFSMTWGIETCPLITSPNPEIVQIAQAWNTLVDALAKPVKVKNADDQYRATIKALRETASLLLPAKDEIKIHFRSQLQFIKQLSYFRFAGIEMYNYCLELVRLVTGQELPAQLSLANFFHELDLRINRLNNPDDAHSANPIAREKEKGRGTFNVGFDPLIKQNIPYLDGEIGINGQQIRILRHGVPFYHHDPYGLIGAVCGKMPLLGRYVNKQNLSSEPVLNADYAAFILAAEEKNENILQAIFEEGEEKLIGDESPRVRGRLKLVLFHKNFYALALRFDGKLFKRNYDLPTSKKESISNLKSRLILALIPSQEPVLSDDQPDLILEKMFKQLEETGFCIPEKVMRKSELRNHIEPLLKEVQELYFPDVKEIEKTEHHQAFILLSYAHIVLFLCIRLNISILEAFCKDDIDRGNAFKTILKLHFLYLTRQISPETLRYVLVNTLAAPFIVKKQAIIDSRLVLIQYALPFMKDAFARNTQPKTTIFGESINNPSYRVFAIQGQTIYPDNRSAKNIEEYLDFLVALPIKIPPFPGNLIEDTATAVDEDQIRYNISQTAKNLNLRVDNELLKPKAEASQSEIDNLYKNVAIERIRAILQMRAEFSESQAWKIASCIHSGFQTRLLEALKKTFDNPQLQAFIELDMDAMKIKPESGFSLTVENKIAKLEFVLFYKIVCKDAELAAGYTLPGMRASITISDLRTGVAQFDWSLVK